MKMRCVSLILLLPLFSVVATETRNSDRNGFAGYKVYAVRAISKVHNDILTLLYNTYLDSEEVQFWGEPGEEGFWLRSAPLLLMVSPAQDQHIRNLFTNAEIPFEVTIQDVAEAMRMELPVLAESVSRDDSFKQTSMTWTAYHPYATIERFAQEIARLYPNFAQISTIGRSYEGRTMYLLKVGKPRADGKVKPVIWIDSQIHAREWVTSAVLTYFVNFLVSEYDTNSMARRMMEEIDWYFVPVVNPDGFDFTHTSANNRMWRRTRRVNPFSQCLGADPNRNMDQYWMVAGATQNPCQDTYAGAFPYSEVENLHVTEAILEHRQKVKAFIGVHSFSQVWLVPWGHNNSYPKDIADMRRMGEQAIASLKKRYNTQYTFGNPQATLGSPGAGGTMDWTYAKAGIKYSQSLELRDKGQFGFILPANQIIPTALETIDSINEVAKIVYDEYPPTTATS
ncbi:carboxypeptidase B-like [Paramacrobiotus metropolitanus]|uniref:carboxypeptidase B-like n=1 Tax=Paramacrobiotus metropolitanus TaxID=2943436 RepID=UPI00244616C4|nr:carboxypeptidase B-like [Paramacrobiotus metropolitanus]